jgi:Holliday junction resolvase RusA-like endonuclease
MSQRDKWAMRSCVLAWRAYADRIRRHVALVDDATLQSGSIHVVCYFPIPASYSKRWRNLLIGQPHRQRPDGDNILKTFQDALFQNDGHVWDASIRKFWDDGHGARVELYLGVSERTDKR